MQCLTLSSRAGLCGENPDAGAGAGRRQRCSTWITSEGEQAGAVCGHGRAGSPSPVPLPPAWLTAGCAGRKPAVRFSSRSVERIWQGFLQKKLHVSPLVGKFLVWVFFFK